MTIQEQIETALIHSGLSQKEFCKKIEMSPSSLIQRMKTGKFTKQELEKMAKAMGCDYISCFRFPDGREY
ncbi:MAG: helix-turn-helix transcriptional regulator [Eubacterium sp.]|nr:helix-turn-helix transcriptional regulator [Eubacterium sp.]